jgi:hypothetical protein
MTEIQDLNVWGSIAFVATLALLGFGLERINGKDGGIADAFLTPIPLGMVGLLMLAERTFV